jgi:hypothetical protein
VECISQKHPDRPPSVGLVCSPYPETFWCGQS